MGLPPMYFFIPRKNLRDRKKVMKFGAKVAFVGAVLPRLIELKLQNQKEMGV